MIEGPLCLRCGAPTLYPVQRCRDCTAPTPAFASARAGVELDEAARRLLVGWKDRGLARVVETVADVIADVVPRRPSDHVCPVPSLDDRSRHRGVDGPADLARALAALWDLPRPERLLLRTSERRQRGARRAERRRQGRRMVVAARPTDRVVLLVDDVHTTGATADACARALRRAGADAVHVVTFARATDRVLPSARCAGSPSPRRPAWRS
jgi:predicted amidophosphoribosyltransferase